MNANPPDHPAGTFDPVMAYDAVVKQTLIKQLERAPSALRAATEVLTDEQLDTKYKNWTVRQITHHVADSHVHSYIRFKWSLTEPNPTIKAYEEADWVLLDDCTTGAIGPALSLMQGLHAKWVQLLESMKREDFQSTFVHPQTNETVSLWAALNYYSWHARHHTGQIRWLCERHGW